MFKRFSRSVRVSVWLILINFLLSAVKLAGVAFAMLGLPVMDAVASVVICIFTLKTTADIMHEAVEKELPDV